MSELQKILKYQETDKKLYKLERELAACEERKEYMKAKKFLEAALEKLDAIDAKASGLKNASAELTQTYLKKEDILKDFTNLDELIEGGADIAFYKKKALALSEELKKIRADLNALTANINATHEEYQKLKKQVIEMQKRYKEFREKYDAVKAQADEARKPIEEELNVLKEGIPEPIMEKYAAKRKERIFPVYGKLNGTRCPFCSMEPPLADRNKLTSGGEIECDSCHRLIFA